MKKLVLLVFLAGCVNYDLAGAPSKDLGVGHLYERLPATAKVATFRTTRSEEEVPARSLVRATDAFTTSLRRTDLFERVVTGTGDAAEIGFEASVDRLDCTQNYTFVWAFYSVFAVIAVPFNLPLSIDEANYEVTLRGVHVPTGATIGRWQARVHLSSWRGAWSLFDTFMDDPGQVFDIAHRDLLNQVVDDYARFRTAILRPAAVEAPR